MTSRILAVVGALFLAWSAVAPAQAQVRNLATHGLWRAFGGTTSDGTPVCGVSSSGDGLYFSLKVFSGDNTVTVQLGSNKWRLAKGDKIRVSLRFDEYPRWNATGTGMQFNDGDWGLEFTVKREELRNFMTQFRASYRMTVQFGSSGMTDWNGNLTGTNAVTDVFAQCVGRLR
jgi:hypothetical protein